MGKKDASSKPDIPAGGLLRKVDREKGYRKAAEFMLLLPKERAAAILARLSPEEIEGIVKEIALLQRLEPDQAKKVFAEFGVTAEEARPGAAETAGGLKGGWETAEGILRQAVDTERAREILSKVEKQLAPAYFDFLKEVNRSQLETLLANESPQVIAMVLAHLEPELASKILPSLPVEKQAEAAKRIAQMDKLLPEVIRRTADTLKKKLFLQADFSTQYINGKSALRDIMKHMEFGQERALLDTLSDERPDLAVELEKELFTMEIFKKVSPKDLQLFLREITDRDMAMSLKGEPPEVRDLLLGGISERRRSLVLEEYAMIGEVPRREAEKAKGVILEALKLKIGKGELAIREDDEKMVP